MKNNTCKRFVAAAMAAMLAVTAVPAPNVQAAAKMPKLSVTKKNMTEGQSFTLKVKNKPAKATLTWKSSNKKVATVTKKGVVKAVKKGKATVSVKVKVKGKKTKTLKCVVTVKAKASQTVSTQKALNDALKDKNVKTITLKTDAAKLFTVSAGNYSNKTFVVDAANADVVNSGVFKEIRIKNIKPDTFTEKAVGNKITVSAKKARIVVDKGAEVANVAVTTANADVLVIVNSDAAVEKVAINAENAKVVVAAEGTVSKVDVAEKSEVTVDVAKDAKVETVAVNAADAKVNVTADGAVSKVEVAQAAEVKVSGSTKDIPVAITSDAAGAKVTAETPIKVEAAAKAEVTLEKGAEGSTINTTAASAEVTVANNTTANVTVTDASGKTTDVASGKTEEVKPSQTPAEPQNPSTPSGGGSSSGGGTTPSVTRYTVTFKDGEEVVGTPVQVESGKTVAKPEDPTSLGARFIGWYKDDILYDFDTPVTENLILTARWEDLYPYAKPMSDDVYSLYKSWDNAPTNLSDFARIEGWNSVLYEGTDANLTYTFKATGSLNYVAGFTGFNKTLAEEQNGYYVPVMVEIPEATVTTSSSFVITTTGHDADGNAVEKKWTGNDADNILDTVDGKRYFSIITHVNDNKAKPTYTIQFAEDKKVTYVIDLSDVTCDPDVKYTVAAVSADSFKHNEASGDSSSSTTDKTKENQNAVEVTQNGCVVTVKVKNGQQVNKFTSSNSDQGEGCWVALDINLCGYAADNSTLSSIKWGSEKNSLSSITLPEPNETDGNKAEANHMWWHIKLDSNEITDKGAIIRYIQISDNGLIIPIVVKVEGEVLVKSAETTSSAN